MPQEDQTPAETPEKKPFAMVLQEMRKGGLHTELGDELADLVLACQETGKKGSITLTLSVDPVNDEIVNVNDKIVVKTPRPDTAPSAFFVDGKGNLSRQNPNQLDISALREVKGGKSDDTGKPLKEVGS